MLASLNSRSAERCIPIAQLQHGASQNYRFLSRKVVLAVSLLFFVPQLLFAQGWTKVATFDGLISLVKFVDENNGFVGLGLSPGKKGYPQPPIEVYRTSDGGRKWIKCVTPSGFNGEISDILMTDSLNGWLAMTCYGGVSSALWRTTDGGWSWNATALPGSGTSVAITSHAMLVTDLLGPGHLSTDGGATFTNGFPNSTNCASFVDDLHGCISVFQGLNWLVTTDGGLSWNPSSMNVEGWSVYGVKGTPTYYSAPEGWTNGRPYTNGLIYKSTNYGQTFSQIASFPFRFTGHLTGIRDSILVFQVIDFDADKDPINHGGFYYSTNQGKYWIGIKGPSALNDTRFCLTDGCYGLRLYGFDNQPNCTLWRYDFSPAPYPFPTFSQKSVALSATLCRDTTGGLRLFNNSCDSITILSIKDLDSNSLAVTSGAFGFDSIRSLPFSLPRGTEDSIGFHWNPEGKLPVDMNFTLHLEVHYFSAMTDSTGDFMLPVNLSATYSGPQYAFSPSHLDMGAISTCATPDTFITLTNFGCVPLFIDSITLHGSGFEVLDTIPASIPIGDSLHLRVRFLPLYGSDSARFSLYVREQGTHSSIHMDLTGRGVQGMGVLDMRSTSLQAGSFSFCSGDTLVTDTLRNTGCDTLVLSKLQLSGDTAFSLVSVPDDSILLLPSQDSSQNILVIPVRFAPRLKGPHAATLTLHEQNIVNDPGHDTTVTIVGYGLGGNTALAADTTTRNFGALFACESRDTTLWLTNPGCDTLMVDTAMLSTAGLALDTTFPLILPGDSSVPVHVSLISSISPNPGSDTGSVTFYSNANTGDSTARIPLVATIIQPLNLTLSLTPAGSAHAGQTVTIYVVLTGDTGAAARELNGLQFVLTHNDDLLGIQNDSGFSWSPGSGNITRTDTFVWQSPTPFQGGGRGVVDTIGSLTFTVYLTDSSTTPLSLSDISLQGPPNIPIDCIASVDSNASAFTYLYYCGDLTIQQAMEHRVLFSIASIVPNPAQSSLEVRVVSADPAGLTYQLFDALGRVRRSGRFTGESAALDVTSLPDGCYYLRINTNGYVQSQSISIER